MHLNCGGEKGQTEPESQKFLSHSSGLQVWGHKQSMGGFGPACCHLPGHARRLHCRLETAFDHLGLSFFHNFETGIPQPCCPSEFSGEHWKKYRFLAVALRHPDSVALVWDPGICVYKEFSSLFWCVSKSGKCCFRSLHILQQGYLLPWVWSKTSLWGSTPPVTQRPWILCCLCPFWINLNIFHHYC